jgi:hypothetical protein
MITPRELITGPRVLLMILESFLGDHLSHDQSTWTEAMDSLQVKEVGQIC